ncbi:LCP family protein [Stackebrandtia nassauensis]|uniref:Cell envelope-related transcriptional attenuator n=1 Tax=Stackebrandtia nassauensis (strain DSM 44728 / CIP 108903 / NRRL B-16338 / NBRC 102104 / LLR-40K-21) TaxID=446470 RepID=D3Q5E0_STANL|nr:LCP family protein [Stackebrandtia nassauensis]ADD46000.1 cell envelope-related transcriptional attenuator [Stackebrandtia nassauensis DSM 44728]
MAERTSGRLAKYARPRKAPLWSKIVLGLGCVLLVLSGGAIAFGKTLLNKIDSIQQEDILGNKDADGEVDGPLNLLMVGADLRPKSGEPARADTIMILHIDKDLEQANIVSIPRDLRVEIPDCGDGQPCTDKINASYTYGGSKPKDGAANLAKTITNNFGVEFDGVALVNFEGFLDVVKEFGGIDLCLPHDLDTKHGGVYKKGCQRYKPDDALAIVRERYAWPDGDYGRQRMQQHFVKQLLKEADKQGYVSNPTKVGGLIDQVGKQLILDLGGIKTSNYAIALRGIKAGDMESVKLPSESQTIDGISYVVIQEGQQKQDADSLFDAIKDDTLSQWLKDHPDYLNKDPSEKDKK